MSTTSTIGRSREPWRSKEMQSLFEAIRDLETVAEAQAFLRDLCTVSELEAMAHRWQVANLLDAGLPYLEVAARSGASTTTVTRVANSLRYGQDGYRRALDRQALDRQALDRQALDRQAPTHTSETREQSSPSATPQEPSSGKKSSSRKQSPVEPRAGARRRAIPSTSPRPSSAGRGARPAPASG